MVEERRPEVLIGKSLVLYLQDQDTLLEVAAPQLTLQVGLCGLLETIEDTLITIKGIGTVEKRIIQKGATDKLTIRSYFFRLLLASLLTEFFPGEVIVFQEVCGMNRV